MPKNRPASGVLNVAAIAPPAPQAQITRSRFSGMRMPWPSAEAIDAPIWAIGPSRPTEPPVPIVRAEAKALTIETRARIRTPFCATAAITSGTPCPRASGAKRWMSGP